jgi:UDP-galactopyranose mutase
MLGKKLYASFFKGYTEKQWGVPVKELEASVTARIPIRYNDNDDYIVEPFQAMPKRGYTSMFQKMLANKNIDLSLNTPFSKKLSKNSKKIIWTGKIDEYYDYKFGHLQYRSLNFIFASFYGREFVQEVGQVNYPEKEVPYTRIVEIKHVTQQKCPNTTISIEIPCDGQDPYYPISTTKTRIIYEKYLKEAENEKNVFFIGRLGKYKYLNMDQCVEGALKLFEEIKNET